MVTKVSLAPIACLLAALIASTMLTSCATSDRDILVKACVKAAHDGSTTLDEPTLDSRCSCASDMANRELDPDNYKLLVGVADIYSKNEPDDLKVSELVEGMVRTGVTIPQASAAAIDFVVVAHKIARKCVKASPNA